jgi:hypothetical protein
MNYYESIYININKIIKDVTNNSIIPPELLFALCCNESGKWLAVKNENIPSRAEPHVLNALKLVQKGEKVNYKGIVMDDLINLSPDKLMELSSSYGMTQIMGWWTLKHIPFSIVDLQDFSLALKATIAILTLSQDKQPMGNELALPYINNLDYESVLRIWNTGKHDGQTYDHDYVKNGFKAIIMWFKYSQ